MISVAVCDDEVIECCNLTKRIRGMLDDMKIPCTVQSFGRGQELLQTSEKFDILFLDIMMYGVDGMRTAHIFREKSFDGILIFISSSREYVFDAYDVEAFQYLLKPVDEKKLKRVLQKAVRKAEDQSREFMIVSKERQKRKLFLDDIYYFEIRGRLIEIHGTEDVFTYYGKIGVLESDLSGKGFFRCHKGYLINLKHVNRYNRQEVILDSGEQIMIAKRRYNEFCEEILAYMRKSGGIL